MYSADLVRKNRFWKISVADNNTTVVTFGAVGSKGRSLTRAFGSISDANDWARAAAAAKEADGYVAAEDPTKRVTRSVAKKRVKEEETASLSAAKKLRRSARKLGPAKSLALKEEDALGEVDPHANIKGSIVTLDGGVCDVMLAEVDIANNVDNFVVLQLIRCDNPKLPYVVFKRWGCTGTVGQIWRDSYKDLGAAVVVFTDLFRETSGHEWGSAPATKPSASSAPRFNVMTQDYLMKRAFVNGSFGTWQYWVDDWVDGKPIGWYSYTPVGNNMAEGLYLEAQLNPAYSCRVVRSGHFSYLMDLRTMTQMNVTHSARKVRHIRRVPPGFIPNMDPPQRALIVSQPLCCSSLWMP